MTGEGDRSGGQAQAADPGDAAPPDLTAQAADPGGAAPPITTAQAELERLRREIAELDRTLITLIATRERLARRAGVAKRSLGLPVLDPPREAAVVRRAGELAREAGLDGDDVRYIFWHLIGLARRAQLEES
jgi:chorismate mutase